MLAQTLAIAGLGTLAVAWLLGRWAAAYDVKGWVTAAVWRAVLRRDWRLLRAKPDQLLEGEADLQRQITGKAREIKTDAARIGVTRTAAKHGSLFSLAYAANLIAVPLWYVGLALLALGAWLWWRG